MAAALMDNFGRAYARLQDVKPGDSLVPDGDFECMKEGEPYTVHADKKDRLYIRCNHFRHQFKHGRLRHKGGRHYLADDDGVLIGLYPA